MLAFNLQYDIVFQRTKNEGGTMELKDVLFSFTGRISRGTFWGIWLGMLVASFFVGLVAGGISGAGSDAETLGLIVLLIFYIPVTWVGLAMQVKRWHDRNRSGWMTLIGLISLIGPLWVLIELGFLPGTEGPNDYGDDPCQSTTERVTYDSTVSRTQSK
jgi:uncharacterized membrane protein YhaH (DUF805 family)